jgi:sugar O-acyltransferase (sialic acid O-acetyltransferase NeuD family)
MICVLFGGGGHAAVLIGELQLARPELELVVLDRDLRLQGTALLGCPIVGDDSALPGLLERGAQHFVVACGSTGDSAQRMALFERGLAAGLSPLSVISPSARVSRHAQLAEGVQALPGCTINARASVGTNTIVNSAALVEHDCVVGDHVHIASGAVLCGTVCVGEGAHIGAGAVLKQGVSVGQGAIVGAGAVVLQDVPERVVVVGVPARLLRQV